MSIIKWVILVIVVIFVMWKAKPYLTGKIIEWRDKRNKKETRKEVNQDLIYVPVQSSRTFDFSITIDEVGSGKATISVVKTK
jgi:hypothetical protein